MILFLDFDGVLHPDEAYWYPGRGVVLKTCNLPEEYQHLDLFCYAEALATVLADFPHVRIVLSTSWVPTIGYSQSRDRLPEALQRRVIGATYHSKHTPRWNYQSRYEQIRENVLYRELGSRWVAVDNDNVGWAEEQMDWLVHTDDNKGFSDLAAHEKLRKILASS